MILQRRVRARTEHPEFGRGFVQTNTCIRILYSTDNVYTEQNKTREERTTAGAHAPVVGIMIGRLWLGLGVLLGSGLVGYQLGHDAGLRAVGVHEEKNSLQLQADAEVARTADSVAAAKAAAVAAGEGSSYDFTAWFPWTSSSKSEPALLATLERRVMGRTVNHLVDMQGDASPMLSLRCAKGVGFDRSLMRKELEEFTRVFKQRPGDQVNSGGASFFHYFGLWCAVRLLRPKHIIESGCYRGVGSWFLRQAAGPDVPMTFVTPDIPDIYVDNQSTTRYYSGPGKFVDFTEIDWTRDRGLDAAARQETLIFFDDHQAAPRRTLEAAQRGFRHLMFGARRCCCVCRPCCLGLSVPFKLPFSSFSSCAIGRMGSLPNASRF